MSQRFSQVLDEASKRVGEWPDWKKSEALKLSEQAVQSKRRAGKEAKEKTTRARSAAAGA